MQARLILDSPADGPRNMAVDEALLASSSASEIPTVRLYAWAPATLSLGYFQSVAARVEHTASQACAVVRRASGGGAILHDQELTYSLTMSCRNRFSQQAIEVVRSVHRSLIQTLATWQIAATLFADQAILPQLTQPPITLPDKPADPFLCFQRRSAEDIVVRGAKIVGSAQRRNHGALVQHGSILLASSPFAPELPGLSEVADQLASRIEAEEFISRWLPHLQTALSLTLQPGGLTDEEEQAAAQFHTQRFATDEWTHRR